MTSFVTLTVLFSEISLLDKNDKISSSLKDYFRSHQNPLKKEPLTVSAVCAGCNAVFSQTLSPPSKKRRISCSNNCYRTLRSKAGKRSAEVQSAERRSLNEKLFAEMCVKKFTHVSCNEAMFDGWDADVILHSEKVAVLWNGRWHYEQVTAQHSVKQVQNRDVLKMKAIEQSGYRVYVIKDMGRHDPEFVTACFGDLVKWLSQVPHKD